MLRLQYIWVHLEAVLSHYSVHFVQSTSTTGSKTNPEDDATITILHHWYNVLKLKVSPLLLQTCLLSL